MSDLAHLTFSLGEMLFGCAASFLAGAIVILVTNSPRDVGG
jgi:hypothetical protein